MNKSVLVLATMMAMVLVSCAPGQPVVDNVVGGRENTDALPHNYSMLEIGRALSKGSVDIYDPWLPSLTVPTPDFAVADPLATFPVHPFMLVRDQRVRVYSLNSDILDLTTSFTNVLSDVELGQGSADAPPIPLITAEPLLP